ncbi:MULTISPECIES: preprotein translocase subunit SecG [Kordiimonas]|jgi:preprotein translocase subunit SecG|uniref:Protein-export membrane protein SecG n=1 Tax=Kordiimonas lacus TaxID=637679 RepID=A0A1G6WEJ3_9PROT|nr:MULTISPECIES: preprotein translocase subunit SecG [Kordiimonas]SDD64143.1 preprotein translocase subunit SecG [Kordiimonas lacus]
METVLLSIHLIVALAMVVAILLQRSEGGALGIGGGQGGMMTARGAGDLLTRTTKWLAIVFLANSLLLGWFAAQKSAEDTVVQEVIQQEQEDGGSQLPEIPTVPEDG